MWLTCHTVRHTGTSCNPGGVVILQSFHGSSSEQDKVCVLVENDETYRFCRKNPRSKKNDVAFATGRTSRTYMSEPPIENNDVAFATGRTSRTHMSEPPIENNDVAFATERTLWKYMSEPPIQHNEHRCAANPRSMLLRHAANLQTLAACYLGVLRTLAARYLGMLRTPRSQKMTWHSPPGGHRGHLCPNPRSKRS
jgi:hypothetical protein